METNPTLVRKYLYEYALICLSCSVIYLFYTVSDLNKFIRTDLIEQKIKNERALNDNTEALKIFSKQLNTNK